MTAKKFNADILERLGEASAEELSAALAAIREDVGAYQGIAATPETVAETRALSEAAGRIRSEQTARAALAEEHAAHLAEIDAATAPEPAADASTDTSVSQPGADIQEAAEATHSDSDGGDAQEGDNADGGDDDNDTEGDGNGDAQEGEEGGTVTASGRRKLGGVQKGNAPAVTLPQAVSRTRAASGLPGIEMGQELDRRQLAEAFAERASSVSRVRSPGGDRHSVATVFTEYPEDRRLGRDWLTNVDRVENAVESSRSISAVDNGQALVAAGLCAPLETLYDIRVIGDVDRPVRDALVRFGADRGGIQYRPAISGVVQTGGIGNWTEANDEADPLVPKTCVEIDCPGIVTAQVEAIYQCLTFSNMSTRFDPEFMDAVVRSQAVAHARFAENKLLTTLTNSSKQVYSNRLLGAVRDALVTLDKMVAYFRSYHRLSTNVPLRMIAPAWLMNLLRADLTRQMVGDGLEVLGVTDEQVAEWFRRRNVNITWHLDGIDPADLTVPEPDITIPNQQYSLLATNSVVPPFPDVVSCLLFVEGDWLWLDGGTLDLGMVRDSTLNEQNRFQTFSESWEFPAFRGVESFHIAMALQPTGQSAATVDTSAATD